MAYHSVQATVPPSTPDPAVDDTLEYVLVSRGTGTLHLPGEDGPRCATNGRFEPKPLSVYPPAHRDWCRDCRRLWSAAH